MKKHCKIYLEGMGYEILDRFEDMSVYCEVCGQPAKDCHHIDSRGMGGSKTKDTLDNLIGLCRECHLSAHKNELSKEYLRNIHNQNLKLDEN